MPIAPAEVITQTMSLLEDVCLLLDDEIDERTLEPAWIPDDAFAFKDALDTLRAVIPKLERAKEAMIRSNKMQSNLQLVPPDASSDENLDAGETSTAARYACGVR